MIHIDVPPDWPMFVLVSLACVFAFGRLAISMKGSLANFGRDVPVVAFAMPVLLAFVMNYTYHQNPEVRISFGTEVSMVCLVLFLLIAKFVNWRESHKRGAEVLAMVVIFAGTYAFVAFLGWLVHLGLFTAGLVPSGWLDEAGLAPLGLLLLAIFAALMFLRELQRPGTVEVPELYEKMGY